MEEEIPITLSADQLHYDVKEQKTIATGNVRVRYRDIEVQAGRVEVDEKKEEARMWENVKVIAQGQVFQGDEITFDLKHTHWTFASAHGEITPDFFKEGVAQPIFLKGQRVSGDPQKVEVSEGVATTCDLAQPHYSIRARSLILIPDQKLIAKDASFYIGDHKIVTVHTFTISMRPVGRRRLPLLPFYGRNDIEGYFFKTSYDYMATEKQLGTLYLDLMEKRGVGVGAQQDYQSRVNNGTAYLYYLKDKTTDNAEVDARFKHRQLLPRDFVADFSLNASKNNAFFGSSNTTTSDLTLHRDVPGYDISLGLHEQRSRSDFSDTVTRTANLQVTKQVTQSTSVSIGEDYQYSRFTIEEPAAQSLTSRLEITRKGKWMDWILRMEQLEDLGKSDISGADLGFFLNKTPEVILETDSLRTGRKLLGIFPATMDIGIGRFKELPEQTSLQRANLNLNLQPYEKKYGNNSSLTLAGAFQQSFYSDNTAQYVLNYRTDLRHNFDSHWSSAITYSRQAPYGFTPFRFDFYNPFNSLDTSFSYKLGDRLNVNLSGGYDLAQNLYRDAILRFQFMPNRTYYFSLSTGYNFNDNNFLDVLTRLRFFSKRKLNLNVTSRFNPLTNQMSRVNAYLDWRFATDWSIQALSGYNGFDKSFDYNQVKLNRSFHDWNAYLTYDQQRREVRIDLALKAFPFFDTRFGVGRSGELLDTSGGDIF